MSTTESSCQDCDILVRNGFVITVDAARTVYPAGAVAILGRDIVAVGPEREVAARFKGRRVLDAGGAPVHPGLIDAHYHVTMHLTRGAVTDDPNERAVGGQDTSKPTLYSQWFNALTDEDEHASAMLASLEMLRNGYTCFMDPGTIFEPDAAAAAVEAVGIRANLADPFLWDLGSGTQMARELERAPPGLERCLEVMGGQLWRNADPEALVQGHIAIYGSASASDELQLAAKVRADEHGVPLHQHQSFHPQSSHDLGPHVRQVEQTADTAHGSGQVNRLLRQLHDPLIHNRVRFASFPRHALGRLRPGRRRRNHLRHQVCKPRRVYARRR